MPCYSFSTASNAMWAECACSNPRPRVRLDSTLDSRGPLSVDCGAWDSQLSAPNPPCPITDPPWGMRSEATKNSPRLGLLDMFPVDEVALHSQHHIGCMIPHESTMDWMTPS